MKDCATCPRNETQAAKIKTLWVRNAQLQKRLCAQQRFIDRIRQDATPTAREAAEQLFREVT